MCLVISNLLAQFLYEGNSGLETFLVPQLSGIFLVLIVRLFLPVWTKRTEKLSVLRVCLCVCVFVYLCMYVGGNINNGKSLNSLEI